MMLGWWVELLPLFAVRWLARRFCERVQVRGVGLCGENTVPAVTARGDVLIAVKEKA